MSQIVVEEEIAVTGTLLNVTLFEDKLMRNFMIINNKLRKLEGLFQLQQKQKAIEKDFKFLTMKVDTLVEKIPKDSSGSLNRNDARNIAKQTFFDIFNSNDEKLKGSKYNQEILKEINSVKQGINNLGKDQKNKKDAPRTSFTAGQVLRETEREKEQGVKISKESLEGILDDREMEIVNDIVDKKQSGPSVADLTDKLDELTKIVEELRLGRGYASFLEREAEKFERFEQYQEKSRQTARKHKQKPIQLEGIKAQNVRGQILKSGLLNQMQRMELNKDQIAKQQLMQRKTMFGSLPRESKREGKDFKEIHSKEGIKERDTFIGSLRDDKEKEFRRSHSIRKLDKLDKRLRVDDIKQLNGVLKQIQLRIEGKVSHDIFMGFVKDSEEKLEAIRIAKDNNGDLNELRKNVYIIQSKLQSIVAYLQSVSGEDEALLVKKQWTCVSCDKGIDKYQGKVGQHLNWQTISSKKISPTKVGAFGQTGQLAAKIRNLMDGREGDQ